jgi:SH3 domain-containing YSC84-like protein 1
MKFSSLFLVFALFFALSAPALARDADKRAEDLQDASKRSAKAAEVFREVMNTPDNSIPDYIIERAEVIAVFPSVIKVGFIVGGRAGSGLVSVRDPQTKQWQAPIFLKIKGGSFGAQIGAESVDMVLIGLNQDSANLFLKEDFELGGELSVAAGPVGRNAAASTDAPSFESKLLSYSRSRGLFAGAVFKGAKISQDSDLNRAVYGQKDISVIRPVSQTSVPASVMVFSDTLNQYKAGFKNSAKTDTVTTDESTAAVQSDTSIELEKEHTDTTANSSMTATTTEKTETESLETEKTEKTETENTADLSTQDKMDTTETAKTTETVDTSSQVATERTDTTETVDTNSQIENVDQKETSVQKTQPRKRLAKD